MTRKYDVREVFFKSGDIMLEGLLSMPEKAGSRAAVVCHPHPLYGGEMKNVLVAKTAMELAERGVPVLRFNFRGVGKSQGAFDDGVGEMTDVRSAIDFVAGESDVSVVDVVGYSFGARVGLEAAARHPRVGRLVGIAPPVSHMEMGNSAVSGKPKLFIRGTRDEYSATEVFDGWYESLPEPKKLVTLEGADHFFAGFVKEVALTVAEYLCGGV